MNCGGTESHGSVGPLSDVSSIQKNGKTVMTASDGQDDVPEPGLPRSPARPPRPSTRAALVRGDRLDELGHRRLGHASASCPRSRRRTLTIEKTRVIASRAIAIADAYPAWSSWNACFQR